MPYIIGGIAGALIAALIVWFICWKKPKDEIQIKNFQVEAENIKLAQRNLELNNSKTIIENQIKEETEKLHNIYQQIDDATFKIDNVKEEAERAKEEFLKSNLAIAEKELESHLEKTGEKYRQAEDEYLKEYLSVMAEMTHTADEDIKKKQEESKTIAANIATLKTQLQDIEEVINAAVEAHKLESAEKSKIDFHRLIIPEEDLAEIQVLRSVLPKIRNPLALNKAIWKVYYEKPYMDLIGRTIGPNKKTGIYKITNINNGMSYVGQAVDVAERWKQHIKRGIGAETPTKNKLYPAMLSEGVENFTFKLLAECPKEQLNEKEDFYQNLFHCKDYGYSIK